MSSAITVYVLNIIERSDGKPTGLYGPFHNQQSADDYMKAIQKASSAPSRFQWKIEPMTRPARRYEYVAAG